MISANPSWITHRGAPLSLLNERQLVQKYERAPTLGRIFADPVKD